MYGEFNDPFDLVLGNYGSSLSKQDSKEFYEAMPDHYKDPAYHIDTYMDIQSGARASVAVMCFTKKYKNILMWSYYSKNHQGLCIGYDYNCDFFHKKYLCHYSDNVGKITRVKYRNDRPKYILPDELVNDTSEWFKKAKNWKYEREYRILLPVNKSIKNGSSLLLYELEPQHIKRVIFGCQMKEPDKQFIYKKLLDYDIEILEAKPHPADSFFVRQKMNLGVSIEKCSDFE